MARRNGTDRRAGATGKRPRAQQGTSGGSGASAGADAPEQGFRRELGLFDSTMVVAGGMIGSGIFLVSADMARLLGSSGWVMVAWAITAVLTLAAALSYGELAAMMPQAGGQYVYLREAFSPLAGFLYGWTLFTVIQTGTVAAVTVGFARHVGIFLPWIAEDRWIVPPVHLSADYALSLSTAQALAIAVVAAITWMHTRGLEYGRLVQDVFTTAKIGILLVLIGLGLLLARHGAGVAQNFGHPWQQQGLVPVSPGLDASTWGGLFSALAIAQVGSLFSSDAWNNITFAAAEVRNPRRDIPLALALGTGLVLSLYVLANLVYFAVLPLPSVQGAASDRVGAAAMEAMLPGVGARLLAAGILVSTFGCANGMLLAGARAFWAMARDGLFFPSAGVLNDRGVPARGLVLQAAWTSMLVLVRTFDPATGKYGNLYGSLLDYVISAALLFYAATILGIFRLRRTRPDAPRPYRAIGYPVVPALYVVAALFLVVQLAIHRGETTWPGFAIVLLGVPVGSWRLRRRGAGRGASSDGRAATGPRDARD